MATDPPELHEDVDLDVDTRRYVLEAHAGLSRLTHYELLGIARQADAKAVKRAYFRLAATVHPDRYFGKRLGSYKSKMEVLFKKISEAHDTLMAMDRRARYDATLGPEVQGAASLPTAPSLKESPKAAAQRQAALDEPNRRAAEAQARARQHAEVATRARAAGDFAAAASALRMALSFAPEDHELRSSYQEMQRAAADRLSETHMRQALLEERYGHWDQAVASWKRVAAAKPADEKVRERLANAIARAARGS